MPNDFDGVLVIGTGTAESANNEVLLALAVVELRDSAHQAFTAAAHTVSRLLQVLADDGVDARSVRTDDLTLGPRMSYTGDGERVNGYQARQDLRVRLGALADLERVLGDVAAQGDSCRIDSLSLASGDPAAAAAAARERAVTDARWTAQQYSAAAGRALGRVRGIRELPAGTWAPQASVLMAGKAGGMPVAPGQAIVRVDVEVTFDFAD